MFRKPIHLLLPTIFLLALLTGCSSLGMNSGPTPLPEDYLPTAVALTAASGATSTASVLSGPFASAASPTPEATLTPSPSPTPDIPPTVTPTRAPEPPLEAIRILAPGPMSKVSSPIRLKAYIVPGADGQIRVELLGEDGRLLARNVLRKTSYLPEGAYVTLKIPFEVRAAAEIGRLQIITEDKFGRPQARAAVHLLLLSVGDDEISPPDAPYARCVLFDPLPDAPVFGGTLTIRGEMQPFNDTPVIVELLDESGKTLGLRVLTLDGGSRQPFATTLAYDVTGPTPARLIVRQADDRISGLIYLYSQEILLNP
ncbi:MAG: hypothetical protein GXP40_00270 [Chloroflexi bacterium]|nr:hypothetical protein [Chloroflexota bacterium]